MSATNWARNIAFNAKAYERPGTVDEVRALVGAADRVRVIGSGHSFNRLADTDGVQLSLAGLAPQLDIDTAGRQVRISAGMTYAALAPRLHAAGLALPNLASLPHISVIGAVATGTHGSGDLNPCLATSVASMEMVMRTGDIVTLCRGDEGFNGSVVALGRLGVVTGLTLDLVPAFGITQYVYDSLPDERLDAEFDAIFASGYSVSVFTDYSINGLWCKVLADAPPPGPAAFGGLVALDPRNPVPGLPTENATPQLGIPGAWYERLPHFRPEFAPSSGNELQSEYLLPRENAVAALRAVRALRAQVQPALRISEIRTVAADDLWLSPAYGRDTAALHFTWRPDADAVMLAVAAIEQALAPYDPRPHWGKVFSQAGHYERMKQFAGLVAGYDPNGKFGNDFVDSLIAQGDA
ncbi:MAG TPA: FAD-binding protein [Jatrophihabitantaceae bacterium]